MLHQGSVYGVSSAAIPHLIEIAPCLPEASRRDPWIEMGFLVTAGADRFPSPPAPGLQEGLTAALGRAEALSVRDFLADSGSAPGESCYYALACVALPGTRWLRDVTVPSPSSGYVRVVCPDCQAVSICTVSPIRWRCCALRLPFGLVSGARRRGCGWCD
jgi:hypothetical protein